VAQLTHAEYDAIERAIAEGRRIVVYRRGTEYVVIPRSLQPHGRREVIDFTHPNTGDHLRFYVDELDSVQVLRDE
jgi:hypothetical protein